MSDISIRSATKEDAEAIAQVHIASWRGGYRGILSDEFLDAMRLEDWTNMWEFGIDTAQENDQDHWIAELAGEVVGFAAVGPPEDEAQGEVRELRLLYITPGQWGKGVGSALVQHVVQDLRARGFKEVVLWVIEANSRARRFYEQRGWRTASGTKPFFIEDVPQVPYRLTLS